MRIVISQATHIQEIARCHQAVFTDSLSTRLGMPFTKKMIEWYIDSDRGIMFHIEHNGEIVAYCGGITTTMPTQEGASTSVLQHSMHTMLLGYVRKPWLILNSENIKRVPLMCKNLLIKLKLYKKKTLPNNEVNTPFQPFCGLVVIGVRPDNRRVGLGSELLRKFEVIAKEKNVSFVTLSVKTNNMVAINAYIKNGWIVKQRQLNNTQLAKILSK